MSNRPNKFHSSVERHEIKEEKTNKKVSKFLMYMTIGVLVFWVLIGLQYLVS